MFLKVSSRDASTHFAFVNGSCIPLLQRASLSQRNVEFASSHAA
jgi:hypothetical protein